MGKSTLVAPFTSPKIFRRMQQNIKVVLVDDHVLLRNALATLVTNLGYEVMFESSNGRELINKLDKTSLPDIILMDINMPGMDGYEATSWLSHHYPEVKVLALSMYDDENAIIRMLKSGAKGYILKETTLSELRQAIDAVLTRGYHYSESVTGRIIRSIHLGEPNLSAAQSLNEKELEFLKLASTEMTYKEIALQMHLSPRTIDGYRDALFEKLNIKSRVGLVLYAVKNGLIHFN